MGLDTFNARSRPHLFRRLSREAFDLLIIGGGITGASTFRDAALRGMRVALVEAKDFASGASGRSSRLIHGGLRYLKTLDLRLVWESCHERNLHLRLNGRLVRPLPFLIPLYSEKGGRCLQMRLGAWLYEGMSGFKDRHAHRFLSREETLSLAPGLPTCGLTGGYLYRDAAVNDTRWTVETLKDGVRNGGMAVNYAPVTAFLKQNGRVVGATCCDRIGGAACDIHARAVVNATGGSVDRVRRLDQPDLSNLVRLSKGTHLLFAEKDVPLTVTTAFFSPMDGRPLFLARQDGCFLFGTSDDWEDTEPDAPRPGQRDVEYLLESLWQFMPWANLSRERVRYVYSGFRPLLVRNGPKADPVAVSRGTLIEVTPSGLISVAGGKLTTARLTALRVLECAIDRIGGPGTYLPCQTHRLPVGGGGEESAERLAYWVRQYPRWMDHLRTLYQRYGAEAHTLCSEAVALTRRRRVDLSDALTCAEVRHLCRREMVCTLTDLIDRRASALAWNSAKRLRYLRRLSQVIRDELDMDEETFEAQCRDYQNHLTQFHALPGSPSALRPPLLQRVQT